MRAPEHYGLCLEEYERHEYAQRDKSWTAHGIDADALIAEACHFDMHVGASLRLMHAFGLRAKESVQFRPFAHVVSFADTGLPADAQKADHYV